MVAKLRTLGILTLAEVRHGMVMKPPKSFRIRVENPRPRSHAGSQT